jgi:hypothetical protein
VSKTLPDRLIEELRFAERLSTLAAGSALLNIMLVRKEVYRHSSILRHKLNQQKRAEPRCADQVLAVRVRTPPS